jgi:hypothetical protein
VTRIAGLVVDDGGQPAVGAHVSIAEPSQAGRSIVFNHWIGETDANGRFEAAGLDAPEYDVCVSWKQAPGRQDPARHRVRTGNTSVHIVLATGTTVCGRVLLDGEPLPHFGVLLMPPNHFAAPTEVRAADGRFALRHVEPGRWWLSVLGPGTWRKVIEDIEVGGQPVVDVGDVAMKLALRISGHVRDLAGVPVADARVIVGRWSRTGIAYATRLEAAFWGEYETTTDRDGEYVFDGIDANQHPARSPHIWAEHDDAGVSIIRELGPTETMIDFTLLRAGHIDGAIVGQIGGFASVIAEHADEPGRARWAKVDAGRFRFDDVPTGDYVVRLNVAGPEQTPPARVTVVADETTTAKLEMTLPSVRLTVRVTTGRAKDLVIEPTSEGAGVGGAIRGISKRGTHDECNLDMVRPGTYRLSLDGKTTTITVTGVVPEQIVDLRR